MRCFLYPPRPDGLDEEDYVDPDIVEPVFFPEAVQIILDDEDEEEEHYDEEEDLEDGNVPLATVSEATQIILTGVLEETNQANHQDEDDVEEGVRVVFPTVEDEDTTDTVDDQDLKSDTVADEHSIQEEFDPVEPGVCSTSVIPQIEVTGDEDVTVTCDGKSPEATTESDSLFVSTNKRQGGSPDSSVPETKRLLLVPDEDSTQFQSGDEAYSNPLASAEEVDGIDDEAFRGDRIGDTTYSERHVLKILMKWIEDLPKYSEPVYTDTSNEIGTDVEDGDEKKLDRLFKKEMTLLWDMSSEQDVMIYLVDKGIFGIVRDSLLSSRCDRLTEISLGILANVLSCAEMSKKLSVEDEFLKLIETVVTVGSGTTQVPILLQVFAVLRRVAWFMHHISPVEVWVSCTVGSPSFLNMLTLILKGSTHSVLIKDAVMVVYFLLEALIRSPESTSENEASEQIDDRVLALATEPVVASLCEGLQELLKVRDEDEAGMRELIDEARVVPHHIQLALRSGLGALCFIQKLPTGENALRTEKDVVTRFVDGLLAEFMEVTSDIDKTQAVEYLVASISLSVFCHLEYDELQIDAILRLIMATQKLLEGEEDGSIVKPVYSAFEEHVTQLARKFGLDAIRKAIDQTQTNWESKAFLEPIYTTLINKTLTMEQAGAKIGSETDDVSKP